MPGGCMLLCALSHAGVERHHNIELMARVLLGRLKNFLQQYLPIGDITASFDYLVDYGALESRWKQIRELQ